MDTKTDKISGCIRQTVQFIDTSEIFCHSRKGGKNGCGKFFCVAGFTLIQNHIIKHDNGPPFSAFLNKMGITFRTPDFDPAFSAGNPDFLSAGRTLIYVIVFSLTETVTDGGKLFPDPGRVFQIELIFSVTFGMVS